jgi:phosphoribosyl 1,2-cyclic phosphodiesterase
MALKKKNSAASPMLRVKIWGARGSLPSPELPETQLNGFKRLFEEFFAQGYRNKADIGKFVSRLPRHKLGGHGGNTPCVEVRSPGAQLIIDGGSGIRLLGYELMGGACGKGKGEVHLLLTHFHWDHLLGLPFFTPIFIAGNVIHVYAVQPELKDAFRTLFHKPYFPVSLEKLGARIVYHALRPRKAFTIADVTITPYQLDHPDPCWGYRFECGGKVFSHCVDTECTRASREELGPDLPLYQGVDLMTFDAQYTITETVEKGNWGHAAAGLGLDIAMREGIKKVVFIHHDPASSSEKIAFAEYQARQYYEGQLRSAGEGRSLLPVDWCFGYEGLVIDV